MRAVMQHEAHRLDALLLCVTEALAELVSDFAHKRQPAFLGVRIQAKRELLKQFQLKGKSRIWP